MDKKELDRIMQELETSGYAQRLEITQKIETLVEHGSTGNKYLEQNNYYAAIAEYSKVADNFSEVTDLATKHESYPPEIIGLYLQTVGQALIGRQVAYLSIGEKEKAHADEKMFDTLSTYMSAINAQLTLERIKAENKKEEGSSLSGCITIIVIIVIIFMFFH